MTKSPSEPLHDPPQSAPTARMRHVLGRIRDEGPAEPFRRFLYRHGWYRRLAVVVSPRLRPRRQGRPLPEGYLPSWLGRADLDDYLALRPDQSAAEIEARLQAGHGAWIVRHRGQVVAHTWIATGRTPLDYLDATLEMAPGVCHVYDDFVAPEHRRHGALRTVTPVRRRYLEEHDLHWRVMTFLPENLLAFRRIGSHRPVFVGEIGRVRVGPWSRLFLRLDRELTAEDDLPLRLLDERGRPAHERRVAGPLGLERAFWARRQAPPGPPGMAALDRAGLHRRRLLAVFASDAPPEGGYRVEVVASRLGLDEIGAYLELRPEQTRDEVERRWRAGHVCFVARAYGRLAAASWLAPGDGAFAELGCELRLAPDVAGVYDEFVRPRLRRMHALNPVDELRGRHAVEHGWKHSVALVPPEVRGAWLRMRRNGWAVLAELASPGVGGLRRPRLRLEPGVAASTLPCTLHHHGRAVPVTPPDAS